MTGGSEPPTSAVPPPEMLLDHVTDAVLVVTEAGRITYCNRRAAEFTGNEPSDLLERTLSEVYPDAENSPVRDAIDGALTGDGPVSAEGYVEPGDRWVAVRGLPHDGGVAVFMRDVSGRVETERDLQAAARYLQDLYDIGADTGREFAAKLPEVLDVGREYLGVETGFLAHIDRDAGVQEIVEARGSHALLQPGESCPLSEAYCRKTIDQDDGLLAIHDAIEAGWEDDPAYDVFELGTYIGGRVMIDGVLYGTLCFADESTRDRAFTDVERVFVELVSQWVAHELARERLLEDLQAQNQSLEHFASVLSHDLRNPLNVASGHVDLLRSEYDDDRFDRVANALDRIEELIEDVLLLTKPEESIEEPEPIHLESVAREAWEAIEAEEASMETGELGRVKGDSGTVRELFENLFRNAVEHGGPAVEIEVDSFERGFYVADDGPGIPAEERETVFEYGHTTEESGTGLGLAIVERIAEIHGWGVEVRERDDGGAWFEFETNTESA